MKQFRRGLSSLLALLALSLPMNDMIGSAKQPVGQTTQIHWAYITDDGSTARVQRASDPTIAVERLQAGEYVITFPTAVGNLGCTATPNNSGGLITCVPGDVSGLLANQVRVITINPFSGLTSLDFTVVVYWNAP